MNENEITYPVRSQRPAWRDGTRFKVVDATGREIARESQFGLAEVIAADMNEANEQRQSGSSFAQ